MGSRKPDCPASMPRRAENQRCSGWQHCTHCIGRIGEMIVLLAQPMQLASH